MPYKCRKCGTPSATNLPSCTRCHHWGTFVDENAAESRSPEFDRPRRLDEIEAEVIEHISSGFEPLDWALGSEEGKIGGWVEGAVYLLSGDPGGGKSTLSLQTFGGFDEVVYLTGEEREEMIKCRAKRLRIRSKKLFIWRQNEINACLAGVDQVAEENEETPQGKKRAARDEPPSRLIVVDSAHSMYSQDVNGAPGSNHQISEVIRQCVEYAKDTLSVMLIIAQINKDSDVAGPRLSEHLVDCTMHLDVPDEDKPERVLRIKKNRYGEAPKKIMLRMTAKGLVPDFDAIEAAA